MLRIILGLIAFVTGWLFGSRQRQARNVPAPAPVQPVNEESLASLTAEVIQLQESAAALRDSVSALDKQLGRVGREQFKANTLGESQQQQVHAALEQLRELNLRRDADLALLRDQLDADQSAQRLSVIERLLPALDGLDEAIAAGQRLLARASQPATGENPHPSVSPSHAPTFQQRVAFAFGRGEWPKAPIEPTDAWRQPVAAWVDGLRLVRERLLEVLASEGVQPIAAHGELFDPHRHVAVEAVPAADGIAPGTIVEEYRTGYQAGGKILRASEVVVAK